MENSMENYRFRFANEKDCRLILKFIRSLAKYEKMEDEVVATQELLREQLFEKKKAEVLFVMDGEKEVGFALFFHNFSTFLGRAGIYLEDLYVRPAYRGRGYGKSQEKSATRNCYGHVGRIGILFLDTDGFHWRFGGRIK